MNDEINNFINEYRKSLDSQYENDVRMAQNEGRTQFRNIMGTSNKLGTMYSNFPERTKRQYYSGTYLPKIANIQQTYKTGLQKLRENAIGLVNNVANVNEEIAILNDLYNDSNDNSNDNSNNNSNDNSNNDLNNVLDNGSNNGSTKDISNYVAGTSVLTDDEQKIFDAAWKKAQHRGYTNVISNEEGTDYDAYDWLEPQERELLESLGLDYTRLF